VHRELRGLPRGQLTRRLGAEAGVKRGVFDPVPVALARVPLLPVTASAGASAGAEAADLLVREGMFLASRHAGALVSGVSREPPGGRAAVTVRSYTLRARSRPTPHGVFAGAAIARFSGRAGPRGLAMGDGHRARTVPDPGWLAAVASRLLDNPDVLPRLTLWASNLTVRRGGRLEHEQPAKPGTSAVRRVTVRATDAAILIMNVCARGARWSTVLDAVSRQWPAAPESSVRGMVTELVQCGFLLTDLLAEGGSGDPLGNLLAKIPAAAEVREDLALIRRHLADADICPPGQPRRFALLAAARDAADRVLLHEHPFYADVALDAQMVLPAGLAREAADAASVLWRVGSGPDPLGAFHDRFADRYGYHRFVRLADVTDPVTGIAAGLPGTPPAPALEPRAILASLIAAAGQGTEVELDTATIEALAATNASPVPVPPRTAEIYVRVVAGSADAAAAGRFHLAVCPGGGTQEAGSSSGRFASLLPGLHETDHHDGAAVVAELVVRSRTPAGASLAPETGFAAHRIPLGVPVRPGDLTVDDLLLISDGQRLLLWSASLDQHIIPVLYSRLSPRLLPPAAQVLRLLGQHGCHPWGPWSWGPLAAMPFQPRVRYQRTILSPARWTLPAAITAACHQSAGWHAALNAWRSTAVPAPPDIVVLADHDRMLPVDLRLAEDRALLRRHIRRGTTAVTEQPGGPDAVQGVVAGPGGQHVLELVVCLTRARPAAAPRRPRTKTTAIRAPGEGLHLPGSRWLSVVIRAPVTCQDEIITRLAAAAEEFSAPWFWLRYSDRSGPHLRVRFHGDPADLGGRILPAMAALTGHLIADRLASGLSVEPYEQEIERYGGSPEAMAAAERVFAADSRLALATLTAAPCTEERIILAALSATTITQRLAGGDRTALEGHHLDRDGRRSMTELRPRTRATTRTTPATITVPPVSRLWDAREETLTAYQSVLDPADRAQCASSLIHLHVNRLLGPGSHEPLVRALAADLLRTCMAALRASPASVS
jgi:lantibiotic biosynthesis protein